MEAQAHKLEIDLWIWCLIWFSCAWISFLCNIMKYLNVRKIIFIVMFPFRFSYHDYYCYFFWSCFISMLASFYFFFGRQARNRFSLSCVLKMYVCTLACHRLTVFDLSKVKNTTNCRLLTLSVNFYLTIFFG